MTAVTGPLAALLTPRTDSGAVDLAALERNVEFVLERGIRGVVPCGGTGEYFDLSKDQRTQAIGRIAAQLKGRGLLIAGIGAGTVADSIELGRDALDSGADAVLLPAPLFYRYDGSDLIGFYREAARAIGGPLLIYNLAAFVSSVPADVVVELIETEENIVGIKDSIGNLEILSELTRRDDLQSCRILGHDLVLGDAVRGGLLDAVISGPAGVIPEATAALFELAGDRESFEQAAALYAEFVRHNEQLPYPWGLKQIAEARGLFKARLPFEPTDARRQQISDYMRWFEEWLERVQQCRLAAKLN